MQSCRRDAEREGDAASEAHGGGGALRDIDKDAGTEAVLLISGVVLCYRRLICGAGVGEFFWGRQLSALVLMSVAGQVRQGSPLAVWESFADAAS